MLDITKLDLVVEELVGWIKKQVEDSGSTGAVFGLSGGADSALVAILCKRAFPATSVGVLMPCHSSKSSLDRALELADKFELRNVTVDLSEAHNSITAQLGNPDAKMATAGLRSCLRAPTLDFVAKLNNALVIGTGNRDEDEIARYYQKRGDGAVDISPIAKLHKSEVYQLLRFLGCPQSIVDAVPTADLWGPDAGQEDEKELGISYPEMEWAILEHDKTGILVPGNGSWIEDPFFVLAYTPRQIEVIKQLRRMELTSRHKANMPPVCPIRDFHPEFFEGYEAPNYKQ